MAAVKRNSPQRARSSDSRYTVMEFIQQFPDDAAALDYLWRRNLSSDGAHAFCPKCQQQRKFHRVMSRPSYSCDTCGHHLHPTAGTIFHKSSTSLQLWFHAIFLMSSTRCGISAKQLERELGVTYKTAWRMFTLIRHELMAQDDEPLSGTVEVDEMYHGGRRKGTWDPEQGKVVRKSGRPKKDEGKTPVFGMVERQGNVVAVVTDDVSTATLMPQIVKRVMPESIVYSDEWPAYRHLSRNGYTHGTVPHGKQVYVDGDVHTNTIEGFWSLVKRGIAGSHHMVSGKYLQGYLNEYVWRFNHRGDEYPTFLSLLDASAAPSSGLTPRPGLGAV